MISTRDELLQILDEAVLTGATYVAVAVSINDYPSEIIINPAFNITSKMSYYATAYNTQLQLKANTNIRIVACDYGYSFNELEQKLKDALAISSS